MEGSSEPTPVETPLEEAPVEEKKTGWMKFAVICGIAGIVCWVLAALLFIPALFGIPFTGCCSGPLCGLGWLAIIAAVIFAILGVMKV